MDKVMNLEQYEANVWGIIDKLIPILMIETHRRDYTGVLETLELLTSSADNLQLADKARVLRRESEDD